MKPPRALLPLLLAGAILNLPGAGRAAVQHVHIDGISFSPDRVTILPGDTVTWDNHVEVIHTVTDRRCGGDGEPCLFDRDLGPGETFSFAFNDPGVFQVRCRIHGFSATIEVASSPDALPDLAVDQVRAVPGTIAGLPQPGVTRVEVSAANPGDASSPAAPLRVEYRYRNRWRLIDEVTLAPMSPGDHRVLVVLWDTTHRIGDFMIRAVADPDGTVTELRAGNNEGRTTASLLTPPGTVPGLDLLDPLGT